MVMAAVPVHVVILDPAVAAGAVPHVIVLVFEALEQLLAPVTDSVAVIEPEAVDGVNVASAGFAFCTKVPPDPVQVGVPE